MNLKNSLFLLILTMLLLLSGCVGTIQDANNLATNSNINKNGKLTFQGIENAAPTAHNRIRVSFPPATGGSGQYSYLVYANGNFALPVASLSSATTAVDSLGKYNVDVKNLQLNTSYTFSVRVYDVVNDQTDSNTLAITARTLSEMVPIFDGAVALTNLPGVDGLTNLLLSWNTAIPAFVDDSGFGNNSHNISGYAVYVGESVASLALAGTVNDATLKSYTIPNLISGRTYYAMVRARNSATPPVEDQNSTVLSKKTLVAQPIQFEGVSSLSIPKTVEGFGTINVAWKAGSGTFDRYKIMVFNSNPGAVVPGVSTPDQTYVVNDLNVVSKTITVPIPNTTYYIAVVACEGNLCANYGGATTVKAIKTTPPVAPFNGIKTITPLDLHSIEIKWDMPDTTQGVYNKIKIFKSTPSGSYDELTDEITENNGATGLVIDSSTDTSIVIKNLAIDTEYCFVAMDYDTFYLTPEYPLGRTNTLRIRSCVTLHYTAPGFLGVNSNCTSPTSGGFTISWSTPSPLGIFDYYEIYVKEGNSGFNFIDAVDGHPDYMKFPPTAKSATSYTFNASSPFLLAADTYYQVGIKTFYNDSGTSRRDTNNSFTINCKTTAATAAHKGWFEILSLGPKIHGPKASLTPGSITTDHAIAERIKPRGLAIDDLNEIKNFEYAQEWPSGSLGEDSSNQGIIKLIWYDFELSNGIGRLYDYATSHPGSVVEYRVYRKAHASKYDTAYKVKAKVSDTDWGSPINTMPITPKMTTLPDGTALYFAEFADYTLTHPYSVDATKGNQGTIYYYKVEAFINGNKVNYDGTYSDSVVRVILPPVNMAFAHRWMLNKKMCGEIGKTSLDNDDVDRDNDYKCLYNGLGSTYDTNSDQYYFDMKGDLLIDRFKMGCNFSRGGTDYSCTDVGYTVAPPNVNQIYFEGSINDMSKGRVIGDCIGFGGRVSGGTNPTGKIKARPGAIFFDRANATCYVNTTGIAFLDEDSKGTTWQTLKSIESSETTVKSASKILPSSISPVGMGWGARIYSNNSYLPHLTGSTQNNLYRTCQSSSVDINGIIHNKRLLRRKEEIATFAMSSFITRAVAQKINYGTLQSGFIDRDCMSSTNASTMYPAGGGAADMDMTLWNYPTAYYNSASSSPMASWMQNSATGSGGSKSTELCFSNFGLQDISGNSNEVLSDRLYCNGLLTKDMCSAGLKDRQILKVADLKPDSELALAQIYTPEIDPDNKYNLKSANGHYLNFTSDTIENGIGVPILNNSVTTGTVVSYNYAVSNSPVTYKYFNPILGVMLSCLGNSCLLNGSYDDNMKVTTKASGGNATIFNYPYIGNTSVLGVSNISPTVFPFIVNGYTGDGAQNGRHSLMIRGNFDGNVQAASGRCTTLIEDYYDQNNQYND